MSRSPDGSRQSWPMPAGEITAVTIAVAVVAGAIWAHPVPVVVVLVGVGVAVRWPRARPVALAVVAMAVASILGDRALAGLQPPPIGRVDQVVTLVADPRPSQWGARVDVRLGSQRVELVANGAAAGALRSALAGERVRVRGTLRSTPPEAAWLVPRHVSARLIADEVERHDAGRQPWRAANHVRRLITGGAGSMDETTRALYVGFILGDQSSQPPGVVDDFRAAGLTHLLVVSGSNVAYVLVLASPLRGRGSPLWYWMAALGLIVGFGVMTRFEPSVLRASTMAALAVSGAALGRPESSLRLVAAAVAVLVLIDPLLVRSVGFQLSVAATVGIVVLGPRIARALPGPRSVAQALSVTVAAQVAVAPLLVPRFGGVPVVAVVANLVAAPVAGLITMWGLPAGLLAGLVGGPVAVVVHLPTRVGIAWVAGVARVAARFPLGELGFTGVGILVVGATLVAVGRRRVWPRWVSGLIVCVMAATLVEPGIRLAHPPVEAHLAPGLVLYRSGGATVLISAGRASAADSLAALRRAGVRRLDLVVVPRVDPALTEALGHRWSVGRMVVTTELDGPWAIQVGDVIVRVPGSGGSVESAPPSVKVEVPRRQAITDPPLPSRG